MKFTKKNGYYQSDDIKYELTNENHSIELIIFYKIFPVFLVDNNYYFKYVVIEKKFGAQTNRRIKCNNDITLKQQVELILHDIALNPELLTSFIGLT